MNPTLFTCIFQFQLLPVDFTDAQACQLTGHVLHAFITAMSSEYKDEKNGENNGIVV